MKSDKPKIACTHIILLFINSLYPELLMDNLKSQCPGVGGVMCPGPLGVKCFPHQFPSPLVSLKYISAHELCYR